MTAKDKARELVDRFKMYDIQICDLMGSELEGYEEKHYKQCALICVDVILNSHIDSVYEAYYLDVKQEITKL